MFKNYDDMLQNRSFIEVNGAREAIERMEKGREMGKME